MKINSRARARDMDRAAEGFLKTRIFLRTVFWQDMPFLHRRFPTHPVFGLSVFRTYQRQWIQWRSMAIEFVERMEYLQRAYLCPPFSMATAGNPEGFSENVRNHMEAYEGQLRERFAIHVSLSNFQMVGHFIPLRANVFINASYIYCRLSFCNMCIASIFLAWATPLHCGTIIFCRNAIFLRFTHALLFLFCRYGTSCTGNTTSTTLFYSDGVLPDRH